jgi:hypothetical protein
MYGTPGGMTENGLEPENKKTVLLPEIAAQKNGFT